jgi:2-polyprenyl-3-methyl-5-hydroxy-6-metoxy-1,4-benzoquinol methylase
MNCSVIEKAVIRKIQALGVSHDAKILDSPCGKAALSEAVSKLGFRVFGTDIDPAAQQFLAERFRKADLNVSLPWDDETFDVACSIEGIEHLENPYQYLRELHRVIRPGGHLILTTPNIISLRSRVRFFGSSFFHKDPLPLNEAGRDPFHHINLRPLHLLRYDLHTNGFHINEVTCTHMKPVSFLYSLLIPWMWAYTGIAFRKEKDPLQRERNREIRKAMFSSDVLFGENLMIVARKQHVNAIGG